MEKNTEYLRLLQERNRLKKMMSTKTKEEQERDELERGFRTQFRGANAEVTKDIEKTAPKVTAKANKPFAVINRLITDASKVWGHSEKKSSAAIGNSSQCNSSAEQVQQHSSESDAIDDGIEYEPDFDEPSDVDEMTMEHDLEGSKRTMDDSSSWNEDDEMNMQMFISQLTHGTDMDCADIQLKSSNETTTTQASLRLSHRSLTDKELTKPTTSIDGSMDAVKPMNSTSMTGVVSSVVNEVYNLPNASSTIVDAGDIDDLDLFLQEKMSKLTSEQKRKLLLALQSSEDVAIPSSLTNDGDAIIAPESAPVAIMLNDRKAQDEKVEVDHKSNGTIHSQGNRLLSSLHSMGPDPTRPMVSIRIRILTTWSKSSFVSLRAIRLRLFNRSIDPSDGEAMKKRDGGRPFVDVLHGLKCRMLQGMVPIPAVSESMRSLSILTAGHDNNLLKQSLRIQSGLQVSTMCRPVGKHQLNAGTWKGPLKPDHPLELVFEGDLCNQLDSNHWANRVSEIELQKSMGLVIWNGSSPTGSFSSAKDVDVYMGSRCVWSGQLAETTSSMSSADDFHSQLYAVEEECPSVVIFPLGGVKPADPPHSQVKRNTSIHANEIPASTADVVTPLHSDSTLSFCANPVVDKVMKEDKPNWLTGIGGSKDNSIIPVRIIDEPPISDQLRMTPSKSKVRRRSAEEPPLGSSSSSVTNQQLLNSPKSPSSWTKQTRSSGVGTSSKEINAASSPGMKSRVAIAERKLTSRRNRNHLLKDLNMRAIADMDGTFIDALSDNLVESSMQQSEADLEKSLDAITFAEKFNLGRLSTTNIDRAAGIDESGVHADDSLDDRPDAVDININPKMSNAAQQSSSLNPIDIRSPNRREGTDNACKLKVTAATKDLRTVERMAKIDFVQEKINNTLAGLAGIMSSLTVTDNAITKRAYIDTSPMRKRDSVEHPTDKAPVHSSYRSEQLPVGETLRLDIYSTWGDQNYVGLNGLEFFDGSGALIQPNLGGMVPSLSNSRDVCIISIEANPPGLGSLVGGDVEDPRKVSNLLDGVNITRNDLHVWLAPQINAMCFEGNDPLQTTDSKFGLVATITVRFNKSTQLSFMRIFNYNKSRAHNQRGVKKCKILLDENTIYEGEVNKASGLNSSNVSHIISFSSDGQVLAQIARQNELLMRVDNDVDLEESWASTSMSRPKTSSGLSTIVESSSTAAECDSNTTSLGALDFSESIKHLPSTEASFDIFEADTVSRMVIGRKDDVLPFIPLVTSDDVDRTALSTKVDHTAIYYVKCRKLRLDIESTWGDLSYVGICGIEVLMSPNNRVLALDSTQIDANPRDLSEVGCFDDPRVLQNLFNGINNTARDSYMWMIPFTKNAKHFIEIDFRTELAVSGLRFWNYNKCTEDILRGCKHLLVSAGDGAPLFRCMLRQGPGCDGVSFAQTILFSDVLTLMDRDHPVYSSSLSGSYKTRKAYISPTLKQDYETTYQASGLLWKITMFNNWNDGYYIGLDAVELFDREGNMIDVVALDAQISAVPYSLDDLDLSRTSRDPRTPLRLFSSSRAGQMDSNASSWLCPLSRCMTPQERANCAYRLLHNYIPKKLQSDSAFSFPKNNVLFIMFNYPVCISAIRFYNYSKTPTRGVKDFMVEVDGAIVYVGSLQRSDGEKPSVQYAKGGHGPKSSISPGISRATRGQSVVFSNDAKIVQTHRDTVSYCGSTEQDVLCINERQVMVRSKSMYDQEPANIFLEGIHADLNKRPSTAFIH